MAKRSVIETGVDKLVKLIGEKKKIALDVAAKSLGVSNIVIEEWADFLEEEGIISIDYKFAKTFLVERKLSKKEITHKAKEFHSSKEAFIRKIETSISKLDNDTKGLDDLKTQFGNLKKEIGGEIELVKDELRKLEDYENFKRGVDKKVGEQQEIFKKKMSDLDKMVLTEQKRYQDLLEKVDIEKQHLIEEKKKLDSLKQYEDQLQKRLVEFKKQIEGVKEVISKEDHDIDISEKHIKKIESLALNIEKTISKKKGSLQPLLEESEKHKKKIREIKREVLDKIAEKHNDIEVKVVNYNKVINKFKKLFNKKNEIENLIVEIEKEREAMKKELNDLSHKAVAFNLISKKSDVKQHIKELEKKFNEIDKNKRKLKAKLLKLIGLISGKS